ncbi:MAG: hypothetical protein JWM75_1378 [Sphingomonas bacterium]|nr:hypothetical protein [Sphingomonas bacterium]
MTDLADATPDTPPAPGDDIAFAPVPVRPRHDGWTPERQEAFVGYLADSGSVSQAAMRVGMTAESAYRLRRRADGADFDKAWEAALAVATRRLVDAAFERAIEGVEEPVHYKGEIVGMRRRPSERLLIFLLRHHDPLVYGNLSGRLDYDPTPADLRGPRIRRFPALLARLLGRGEPRISSRRLS